jgi:hypothetical protein
VRSYRTVSPLPHPRKDEAVCSLLHFPSRRRASPLASMLPVGVRTFLSARPEGSAERPPEDLRKPNSVSLRLPRAPCGARGQLRADDHSSSPAIAGRVKRPTRRLWTGRPMAPPYLALLRAGFCLPPVLPRARCALTAPFHPYPSASKGGMFSVPLSFRSP